MHQENIAKKILIRKEKKRKEKKRKESIYQYYFSNIFYRKVAESIMKYTIRLKYYSR